MENQKNNKKIIILLISIIVILFVLVLLLIIGIVSFNSNNIDNSESNGANDLSKICTADEWDSKYLKELVIENKTETIHAMGGDKRGYNVTTTVTKEHNYTSTPENEEFYANDLFGTLYILYKDKLYYTSQKDTISRYCDANEINNTKLSCDYSKFNDNAIKEFNVININLNFKSIGSYGNSESGSLYPYAITTDGKVINIPKFFSNDYNCCGILYDNSEYPIDRILYMNFYDGGEYTILLKNGTLITRDVDYENTIELEY